MQRWLARQSAGRPRRSILSGLVMIAAGVVGTVVSVDAGRYFGAALIALGALNMAIGIAALSERRPDSHS